MGVLAPVVIQTASCGLAILVVVSLLAGCGESHDGYVPPPDAPIDHELDYTELSDEEATLLCEWWAEQVERVVDGPTSLTRCGVAWLSPFSLEQCVEARLHYGEQAGCSIPVRTFYECATATPYENYCDPETGLPAPECGVDEACLTPDGLWEYLLP